MLTVAQRLQELAGREPLLQQAEAAKRVGVSREYVRQLTNRLGLPFAKGNKRVRLLRLYESGLHQKAIAKTLGVTSIHVRAVLKEEGLPLRKHPRVCQFCNEPFDAAREDTRFCPRNCNNGKRVHDWVVRKWGNNECFSCGLPRAASFRQPCSAGRRRHFFIRRTRAARHGDGKEA